jgi:hypothetical protein
MGFMLTVHMKFLLGPIVPSINKMGCFPRFFILFYFGLVAINHFDWPITKERIETWKTPQNRSLCVNT